MSDMPLLELENLRVSFPTPQGRVEVVKGLSFTLGRERLGIVGESGSGKSMTGRAILRLVRKPGRQQADRMIFDGIDLQGLSERKMRDLRGARISMIMQDPKFSLNPVMTIGAQIAEALKTHENLARSEVKSRVLEMLHSVRINDPERVVNLYPHEVSGGMGQRIMIAMMLIPRPDLLIADEPTSALDVSVQAQVLDLIDELVRDYMGAAPPIAPPQPGDVMVQPQAGAQPEVIEPTVRESSGVVRPVDIPASGDRK